MASQTHRSLYGRQSCLLPSGLHIKLRGCKLTLQAGHLHTASIIEEQKTIFTGFVMSPV